MALKLVTQFICQSYIHFVTLYLQNVDEHELTRQIRVWNPTQIWQDRQLRKPMGYSVEKCRISCFGI
jgi:hypothetical protein